MAAAAAWAAQRLGSWKYVDYVIKPKFSRWDFNFSHALQLEQLATQSRAKDV
jgi:hypothetical protein